MRRRIYIAENDAAEEAKLRDFFSLFRFEIIKLESLQELTQQDSSTDVVLVDLYFQPKDLLKDLAQLKPSAAVIFLTTPRFLFDEEDEISRKLGLNILRKPIDYEVLYGRLVDQMEIQ